MTTETNTAFEGFKDAFKNIQNLEVPEAAREFVKKTANTAKDRAAEVFAGSERVTAAVENAVTESVTEAGKISRNIQQAIYEDAEAFFSGIDKLASAKSISEAKPSRSSRACSAPAAKSSSRAPRRPPTMSASSLPTVRSPLRTILPRSTPRPLDTAS
ncbi:phasin [Bradyrhizobium japonicum]